MREKSSKSRSESRPGRTGPVADGNRNRYRDTQHKLQAESAAIAGLMGSPTGQVLHLKAKVCLLGGLGVGKTSLVRRYVLDEFDDHYVITLGAKVTKREVDVGIEGVGPVRVDLTLWDTMGEESLRPTLTDIVLHGIKGVLGVCDVSDRRTIGPMASWIDLTSGLRPGIPVQILANKSDLPRKEQAMRDVLNLGRRHAAPCYLTSAKTGDNVTAAFEDLALRITTQALSESESRLDPASLGIVVETSVKPRSFLELVVSTGLPPASVLFRAESLVRRGFLRVASMDIGPDGRPLLSFASTGKTFPPLEGKAAAETRNR